MAACTPADDDFLYICARLRLGFHDLPETITDATETRDIQADQAVQITFHSEADDGRARMRIRERSPIAKKLRHDMQALRQPDGVGGVSCSFCCGVGD